jgi:hypothetical protein
VDWLGEFFRALPGVVRALWQFGDGFYGVAIMLGSLALIAAFTFVAIRLREIRGWLSSVFAVMAITIGMWWGFGILPSAWVYFADGERDLLEERWSPDRARRLEGAERGDAGNLAAISLAGLWHGRPPATQRPGSPGRGNLPGSHRNPIAAAALYDV